MTTYIPSPGQRYRHYKGGSYVVLEIEIDVDTSELRVSYRCLNTGHVFSRLLQNATDPKTGKPSGWLDPVTVDLLGEATFQIARFELVTD